MMHASEPGAAVPADPRDAIVLHVPALRGFAISLTRDQVAADDLVQDTIVKAWTNFHRFEPGTDLKAWLFTILRNTFFSQRRRAVREVADPDGIHAATLAVRPAHDGRLAFADFRAAFDQLSAEHREVLILVGANGYSCEEAAAMMGVAVGTVKSRTNRARARLCELLGLTQGETDFGRPDALSLAAVLHPAGSEV
jgi:RNA polymerase sigma-70 factor (ECF subfamily)